MLKPDYQVWFVAGPPLDSLATAIDQTLTAVSSFKPMNVKKLIKNMGSICQEEVCLLDPLFISFNWYIYEQLL